MTEQPSLHEELVHLRSEIGRLTDEISDLAKENDVLRSEINFLKRAAEYFYKESLDARRGRSEIAVAIEPRHEDAGEGHGAEPLAGRPHGLG